MDTEIPLLSGYVNVPAQSGFSLNRIAKKKVCPRYCLLFKSSRHGIERLELCESKGDKNPKIITLEDCVKITQEPAPANLIQIVKKTGTLTLNTLTDSDLKEWVNALQTVAFRDKGTANEPFAIEEENDLYCSSFGDGLFIITLIASETSIRCNIEPKSYILHLTATELQLKSTEDINSVTASWPYRYIRKYGYRDGKFTFEAGRKCSTGEGVFTLDHTNPQEVFRCMSAKMKSMKKLITNDCMAIMNSGESQLSVAASMEAGSRSPLPQSSSQQIPTDLEMNSPLGSFMSSGDSANNFSVNLGNSLTSLHSSSAKHIPSKPPRKLPLSLEKVAPRSSQLSCDQFKKFINYEPVSITTSIDSTKIGGSTVVLMPTSETLRTSGPPDLPVRNESSKIDTAKDRDYESIEIITDAWKTLGVGEVKHTERDVSGSTDDDRSGFSSHQSTIQREKGSLKKCNSLVKTHKIIDIDIGEGSSCIANQNIYDSLDFLSPNNTNASGYKTILNVASLNRLYNNQHNTSNDYELIATPDVECYRKADDSHLGYGVIRNPTTSQRLAAPAIDCLVTTSSKANKLNESTLKHHNYGGFDYTIVSKPK